ncbi:GrpE, mitochondrial [Hypsizygus marmoreus]|uniref:GrpE protein homolog, mitochondrial n=1 Tax=Hypsizygus marmoreus TaxID=39966 RepID=A0A369JGR1_HYPMA|nr:GrpE, mitochondrial [Hypsizygus marmoreus]
MAMTAAHALQTLRSSTALLSSRTLARSAAMSRPTRMALSSRRHYSEEKLPPPSEDSKEGAKPAEPAVPPEVAKLKAKEAEVTDLTHRLRYLQADFVNLQRNAAREKEQTRDYAISHFASDLLETADVLALALKAIPKSALPSNNDSESSEPELPIDSTTKLPEHYLQELYDGVELTYRQLLHTFFKHHIKPYDPTGDQFNPNLHEALYQAPIPGKEPGTVIDCQKTGYMIKDRVLRAAQVGVAQDTS